MKFINTKITGCYIIESNLLEDLRDFKLKSKKLIEKVANGYFFYEKNHPQKIFKKNINKILNQINDK